MYALQVAVTNEQGDVFASLKHYARMFDAVGVASACLYRGQSVKALRDDGVRVVDAPGSLTSPLFCVSFDRLMLPGAIRKAGGRKAPDLVVVHSDAALRPMRGLFPNAVLVATGYSDRAKGKRDANIVITLNPEQHARMTRDLAGARARVVMLGQPFVTEPVSAADGPVRVNFVGPFIADKDPMTFVLAASMMHASPKPEFRFIGSGPLEKDLRKISTAIGVNATFESWPVAPLEDFGRNDILVSPSISEGFPSLLLEAQARGVPAIASNIPGNMFAMGDGAYGDVFPKGDAAALSLLLDNAVANLDGLRAKAERGRKDLPARFGPHAFWGALQEAMRDVKSA